MSRIVTNFGITYEDPVSIWCDNVSCISIAKKPTLHGIMKHINVRFHFIKELVSNKVVSLNFCKSVNQQDDIFTKCLNVRHHYKFRELLGVCSLQSRGRLLVV